MTEAEDTPGVDPGLSGDMRVIAKASGILAATELLIKPLGAVSMFLFTNLLGASGYGIYSVARSILELLPSTVGMGIKQGLIRYGSAAYQQGDKVAEKRVINVALLLSIILPSALGVVLVALAPIIGPRLFSETDATPLVRYGALGAPILGLSLITSTLVLPRRNVVPQSVGRLVNLLTLTLSFGAAAWLLGKSSAAVAVGAYLLAEGTNALVCLVMYWQSTPDLRPIRAGLDWRTTRDILAYVPALGLSMVGENVMSRVSLPVSAIWLTAADTGRLAVGIRLTLLGGLVVVALQSVLPSLLAAHLESGNRERAAVVAKETSRWVALAFLPVLGVLMVCAHGLGRLMGKDFHSAAPIIVLTAFANMGYALGSNAGMYALTMTGRQWVVGIVSVLTGALSLGLIPLLAPRYGVLGATVAFVAGRLARHILYILLGTRVLGAVPIDVKCWKYFAALGAAAAVALPIPTAHALGAAVQVVVFSGAYLVGVVILGLEPVEKELLAKAASRLRRRTTPGGQ